MGFPFLIVRKETGKFDYFRQIPAALQPHMLRQIAIPWRSKINAYTAPKTIKIALHTGDDTEALKRRDQIAVQVEDMYRQAEDRLNARQKLELAQQIHTLTQAQVKQMGNQVRDDILKS
jgi:hypothetical protein